MEVISPRHATRYWRIINQARLLDRRRGEQTYFERHHIIPRALGGSDEPSNIVLLTAREHFVCHFLLWKMTGDYRMLCAVLRMRRQNEITTSRLYEAARLALSAKRKGMTFDDEHRAKLARAKRGAPGNNRRAWEITDPHGVTTVTKDRRDYCLTHGLNWESVKVMTQKGPHYKGYLFKRVA